MAEDKKDCENCKFFDIGFGEYPCLACEGYNLWEPSSPIKEADVLGKEAGELVDKFHYQICNDCGLSQSDSTEFAAKQCALIAVGMVIEALKRQNPNFEDNTYWSPIDYQQQLKEYIHYKTI